MFTSSMSFMNNPSNYKQIKMLNIFHIDAMLTFQILELFYINKGRLINIKK